MPALTDRWRSRGETNGSRLIRWTCGYRLRTSARRECEARRGWRHKRLLRRCADPVRRGLCPADSGPGSPLRQPPRIRRRRGSPVGSGRSRRRRTQSAMSGSIRASTTCGFLASSTRAMATPTADPPNKPALHSRSACLSSNSSRASQVRARVAAANSSSSQSGQPALFSKCANWPSVLRKPPRTSRG